MLTKGKSERDSLGISIEMLVPQDHLLRKIDCAVNFSRIYDFTESRDCQKTVLRHIWQDYMERAEDVRHSPHGKTTYKLRSQTIERVFADAKEKYSMRFTPYRWLKRVGMWVKLKYAAMNFKKLAIWKWNAARFRFIRILYQKEPLFCCCMIGVL